MKRPKFVVLRRAQLCTITTEAIKNLQDHLVLQNSSSHLQKSQTYLLPQFFVFGLQILAVAAPRCIELYQDIFVLCINNFIKVLSHHHL